MGKKHLSAESGLYCRIYIEGLFGIRPTGLQTFNLTPQLPEVWNEMSLKQIHGFGQVFDIEVEKKKDLLNLSVLVNERKVYNQLIPIGTTVEIDFNRLLNLQP